MATHGSGGGVRPGEGDLATKPTLRSVHVECDVAVVGGGLAGVCAAVAAARRGRRVALLQNRPVLGGNSSSEVRVWVCGATGHGNLQWARETGLMGELFLENQYRNPEGNPYYWDLVVEELVRSEPGIDLWLNTDVRDVHVSEGRIESVTGWQMGSEKIVTVRAAMVVDATGDGLVGHLAGADYAIGRESRDEYGESWASDGDARTLGSTILFYTKDHGAPSRFVPPPWSFPFAQIPLERRRLLRSTMNGCDYWWIEWGGDKDVVADNELVRDKLQAIIYGIWDHIKNSGEFDDVENRTLEWIGALPGKREYRRFLGDHVLVQDDVIGRPDVADNVGFGGWSIDLHPPGGIFAPASPSRHWWPAGPYRIPLRCLYSRNIPNLWVAGRDISASHVAFGSVRVMATCAVTGEAAGLAAAVALEHRLSPRQLACERFDLMAHALVRSDASVQGLRNDDPADLAREATVAVSSTERRLEGRPVATADGEAATLPGERSVGEGVGWIVPTGAGLDCFEVYARCDDPAALRLDVLELERPQDTYPGQARGGIQGVGTGAGWQWVSFDLTGLAPTQRNVFLALSGAGVVMPGEPPAGGVLSFVRRTPSPDESHIEHFREWTLRSDAAPFAFRVPGETSVFGAENLVGGYARPYGGPNMWCSDAADPAPALTLSWTEPVKAAEIQVVLDDSVDVDLINLHHHRTEHLVMPTLVRDADLEIETAQGWRVVAEVRENRRRCLRFDVAEGTLMTGVRLRVLATNGSPRAHVVKVRVYAR